MVLKSTVLFHIPNRLPPPSFPSNPRNQLCIPPRIPRIPRARTTRTILPFVWRLRRRLLHAPFQKPGPQISQRLTTTACAALSYRPGSGRHGAAVVGVGSHVGEEVVIQGGGAGRPVEGRGG